MYMYNIYRIQSVLQDHHPFLIHFKNPPNYKTGKVEVVQKEHSRQTLRGPSLLMGIITLKF